MKIAYSVLGILFLGYCIVHFSEIGKGEIITAVFCITALSVAWFGFKKDLSGMFVSGIILGTAVEFITEAYWDYSFKMFIWRDIPLFVIVGWGYSFSLFILLSDWVFKKVFRPKNIAVDDKRILLCDALLGPLWFVSHELLGMNVFHLWTYSKVSGWTYIIPVINFPWEGVIGAVLFATVLPTFVRHWEKAFRLTKITIQNTITTK
jgi:hypothetical protein